MVVLFCTNTRLEVTVASNHKIENMDVESDLETLQGREGKGGEKSNNILDQRCLLESNKQSHFILGCLGRRQGQMLLCEMENEGW